MEIKVEGATEVITQLENLDDDLKDIPTMMMVARNYATIASSLAPRRTGFLANSIRPTASENKANATATAPYAAAINYGAPRRGILATHFMNRVDQIALSTTIDLIASGVQTIIDEGA